MERDGVAIRGSGAVKPQRAKAIAAARTHVDRGFVEAANAPLGEWPDLADIEPARVAD
jgi:hypothetical protein